MSRYDRNRSTTTAPQQRLGAREITRFDGHLANDNGGAPKKKLNRHDFALPTVAFLSGLSAASLVALAERWLGL